LEASLHGSRVVRRGPAGESGVDAKDDPRELTGLGPECIFSEKVEAGSRLAPKPAAALTSVTASGNV